MSNSSAISLIVFLSLIAFSVSSSVLVMLISAAIMCTIWYGAGRKKMPLHLHKLALENTDYTDAALIDDLNLPQASVLLASLRKQMPRVTHALPLRPENHLFDDLDLDPVAFEMDHMPNLCDQLGLTYDIDHQNPLWEQVFTVQDLANYIAKLNQTHPD